MKKRRILILTALLTTALAGCGRESPAGEEKTYPLEAVELIAPAGPGGGYDLTIRAVAQCLQEEGLVDVPLPVTNKPGGGGRLCLEYMHEKQGNDDMLVVYSPPLCLINLNGSTKLNYRDNTTPIAKLAVDYGCFAVKADSPYRTLNDVMSRLKEDPKAVKIGGTSSEYSMDHVQFLKIAHAAGVKDLQLIPYEGFENGGVMAQLMGERVDVMSAGISDVLGAGRDRAGAPGGGCDLADSHLPGAGHRCGVLQLAGDFRPGEYAGLRGGILGGDASRDGPNSGVGRGLRPVRLDRGLPGARGFRQISRPGQRGVRAAAG